MESKVKGVLPAPAHLAECVRGLANLTSTVKPLIEITHSTVIPEKSEKQISSESGRSSI